MADLFYDDRWHFTSDRHETAGGHAVRRRDRRESHEHEIWVPENNDEQDIESGSGGSSGGSSPAPCARCGCPPYEHLLHRLIAAPTTGPLTLLVNGRS